MPRCCCEAEGEAVATAAGIERAVRLDVAHGEQGPGALKWLVVPNYEHTVG
jgi:hypothetical protein